MSQRPRPSPSSCSSSASRRRPGWQWWAPRTQPPLQGGPQVAPTSTHTPRPEQGGGPGTALPPDFLTLHSLSPLLGRLAPLPHTPAGGQACRALRWATGGSEAPPPPCLQTPVLLIYPHCLQLCGHSVGRGHPSSWVHGGVQQAVTWAPSGVSWARSPVLAPPRLSVTPNGPTVCFQDPGKQLLLQAGRLPPATQG